MPGPSHLASHSTANVLAGAADAFMTEPEVEEEDWGDEWRGAYAVPDDGVASTDQAGDHVWTLMESAHLKSWHWEVDSHDVQQTEAAISLDLPPDPIGWVAPALPIQGIDNMPLAFLERQGR